MEEGKLIYCVDDDADIRSVYECALPLGGFRFKTLASGSELWAALSEEKCDLLLLDLMLPGEDGFDLLSRLKQDARYLDIPVIVVSAKSGETDTVKGLDLGAADYIYKPFKVMELLARIKANLRKSGPSSAISYKGISYDPSRKSFSANGENMKLTNKERQILELLFSFRGKLVKKEDLVKAVWPDAVDIETRTVDVHISMVRRKLSPLGIDIKTIRSLGYILE